MNQMMKLSIAGSTVVCAALLSFSWSEQRGVSLSVDSAQAQSSNNRGGLVGGADNGTGGGGGFGRVSYGRTGSTGAYRVHRGARVAGAAAGGGYYVGDPNNRGGLVGGGDQGVGGGFGRPSYGFTGATGTYRVGAGGWGGGPYYGSSAAWYGGGPNNQPGLVGGDDSGTAPGSSGGWYLSGGVMKCASGAPVIGGHGRPMLCP
jgi:hypothetical protein